jgi:hypothetical protein
VKLFGENGNYPNATGSSPFPAHPTPQKLWNSAAFDTTNPNLYYQIGNTGINTLLTPHTLHVLDDPTCVWKPREKAAVPQQTLPDG